MKPVDYYVSYYIIWAFDKEAFTNGFASRRKQEERKKGVVVERRVDLNITGMEPLAALVPELDRPDAVTCYPVVKRNLGGRKKKSDK